MRWLNCGIASIVPRPGPRPAIAPPQPVEVAAVIAILAELDARGHVQQGADRRAAVFAALQARHILLRQVIDRADRAFGDGQADQQAGDRFTSDG
jgi:hypothetical protein